MRTIDDRAGRHDERVWVWFRLLLRFALGATMVGYGAFKVIPVQMPEPSLLRLLTPFGDLSPMGVLWAAMGAARPYQMFAGAVEMLGGALLFLPRTTLLGAIIGLGSAIQVLALNLSYDVPVKLFSFHMVLVSLLLIAPDAPRLIRVLFGQPTGPSTKPPLAPGPRGWRVALTAQLASGVFIIGMNLYSAQQAFYSDATIGFGLWALDSWPVHA
jgi:hypothetical protein